MTHGSHVPKKAPAPAAKKAPSMTMPMPMQMPMPEQVMRKHEHDTYGKKFKHKMSQEAHGPADFSA